MTSTSHYHVTCRGDVISATIAFSRSCRSRRLCSNSQCSIWLSSGVWWSGVWASMWVGTGGTTVLGFGTCLAYSKAWNRITRLLNKINFRFQKITIITHNIRYNTSSELCRINQKYITSISFNIRSWSMQDGKLRNMITEDQLSKCQKWALGDIRNRIFLRNGGLIKLGLYADRLIENRTPILCGFHPGSRQMGRLKGLAYKKISHLININDGC